MKNCVTFPSSFKSIPYFSFFCVINLKAVEGLFMLFRTKIRFDTFLSDGQKCISIQLKYTIEGVSKILVPRDQREAEGNRSGQGEPESC